MPIQSKFKTWFCSILLFSVLFSCTNNMEEYYERPSWLKGNAWEVLSEKGNYTIFLSIVEKAGYKTLVNGKGVVTVIAPTDEVFSAYLKSKNYSSVNDMPLEEATKLASTHLVYYSFNKDEFANFNPYGSGNANPLEAGLFYKHRTKAKDTISIEYGAYMEENSATYSYGDVSVVHYEHFLPVFSSYLFNTKSIGAAYNYGYFYPNNSWTGDNGGFNVANASVNEYAIVTDNGYVHLVNQVLEPLQTIHQSLKGKSNYSDFITMYDKFSYYWKDDVATKAYGNGTDLFTHLHVGLPAIASEVVYSGSSATANQSRDAYSAFVPNNEAMQKFFNDYWAGSYNTLANVYSYQMRYFLENQVFSGSVVFPEEVKKGKIVTGDGTTVQFDPDKDVVSKEVCANGVYYGLNTVQVPKAFKCVAGPVFRSSDYKMFMYMLEYTGQSLSLTSPSITYTMFLPSDAKVLSAGYGEFPIQYRNLDPFSILDDRIQVNEGGWRDMTVTEMNNYINSHTATELLTEANGYKVYKTRNNFSYLYVKNNSVASNEMYNENSEFKDIQAISGEWYNGTPYNSDAVLLKTNVTFKSEIGSADEVAYLKDYEEFSKLLTLAGLLPINAPLDFIADNYMVFVPSNETILNAPPGTIPTEPTALAKYLKYYFVPTTLNSVSNYPFVGALTAGDYFTYQEIDPATRETSQVNISEVGGKIHLTSGSGQADVISVLPKVYSDGAAYLINGLIQPK